jgi:hypothetical protein
MTSIYIFWKSTNDGSIGGFSIDPAKPLTELQPTLVVEQRVARLDVRLIRPLHLLHQLAQSRDFDAKLIPLRSSARVLPHNEREPRLVLPPRRAHRVRRFGEIPYE